MPVLVYLDAQLSGNPAVRFKTTCFDTPGAGRWSSIEPDSSAWPAPVCFDIFHYSRPLQQHQNIINCNIIRHLETDMEGWLSAESVAPINISRRFALVDHMLRPQDLPTGEAGTRLGVVRLIFDYLAQVSEQQRRISSIENPIQFQMTWSDVEETPHYPAPDFVFPSDTSGFSSDGRVAALLLLMRSPQFYDGATDYMYERYMKSVINLLFDSYPIMFLEDSDCTSSDPPSQYSHSGPLLVACGCGEFSQIIKEKMAAAVRPILMRMVQHSHLSTNASLPSFAFVYGIHWSRTQVRIIVHFPSYDDHSRAWKFVQAVVAEHWVGIRNTGPTQLQQRFVFEDDMFLRRWRLTIALFSVLTHVKYIERWLNTGSRTDLKMKSMQQMHHVDSKRKDTVNNPYLEQMRSTWAGTPFLIPREWVMSPLAVMCTEPDKTSRLDKTEITTSKTLQYLKLYLQPLSRFLEPMSKEQVVLNHEQYSTIPDYILLRHLPRGANFVRTIKRPDVDTNAHAFKLHDLVSMQVTNWHDVNIYVANVFSGFASYGVRWRPQIQTKPSSHVIVDFALVVQKIAPTTDESICRALLTPPTITSPAILLGFRLCSMGNADGAVITSHDTAALIEIMTPYVIMASKHLSYLPHADEKSHNSSIVLATLLKAGYLHIIAFPPLADISASPQMVLLDTIPLVMQSRTLEDRLSRVRLAIALFTLQRHVVRFSDEWDDTVWPEEAVYEEYERVIKPLGLCTPSPTANDEPDHLWWDDPAGGSSISKIYDSKFFFEFDTDDEEDEYEEDDSDEDEEDEEQVEARKAEAELRIRARNENRWAWLKEAYESFKEWELLEDMERVERWVREYDPRTLDQMGVPLP